MSSNYWHHTYAWKSKVPINHMVHMHIRGLPGKNQSALPFSNSERLKHPNLRITVFYYIISKTKWENLTKNWCGEW